MFSTKKLLVKLSIGASLLSFPIWAEDNSGWYATGSVGINKITDLDYKDKIPSHKETIQFDDGLGFDLGFGYDFGSTRIEGTWNRGQSPGGLDTRVVFKTDASIDSLLLSGFYDFRSSKQWSPFVGISVGSTRVDHLNVDDTGTSYGIGFGISYKTSDTTEVFYKSTAIVTPELDTLSITNGVYGNGTIGVRFIF